jgi:hypothetical protein
VRTALWIALAAALVLCGVAAAETGQSPDCRRYCLAVEPSAAPEGSVFRFEGRRWRPNRRVTVTFGAYCRPHEACPAIAYFARVRTNGRGRFVFRLRAGQEQPGDAQKGIRTGGVPTFTQRARSGRRVSRTPRYRVIVPASRAAR